MSALFKNHMEGENEGTAADSNYGLPPVLYTRAWFNCLAKHIDADVDITGTSGLLDEFLLRTHWRMLLIGKYI